MTNQSADFDKAARSAFLFVCVLILFCFCLFALPKYLNCWLKWSRCWHEQPRFNLNLRILESNHEEFPFVTALLFYLIIFPSSSQGPLARTSTGTSDSCFFDKMWHHLPVSWLNPAFLYLYFCDPARYHWSVHCFPVYKKKNSHKYGQNIQTNLENITLPRRG